MPLLQTVAAFPRIASCLLSLTPGQAQNKTFTKTGLARTSRADARQSCQEGRRQERTPIALSPETLENTAHWGVKPQGGKTGKYKGVRTMSINYQFGVHVYSPLLYMLSDAWHLGLK